MQRSGPRRRPIGTPRMSGRSMNWSIHCVMTSAGGCRTSRRCTAAPPLGCSVCCAIPGRRPRDTVGSGFLCVENDDPTAERQLQMFTNVGITAADITSWNAYPWYIDAAPRPAQLDAGIAPLLALLDLMPAVRVVFLDFYSGIECRALGCLFGRLYP
jgi:hypothetical protein